MSLEERDWFREEKLPDGATGAGDDGYDTYLVEDGHGYRVERRVRARVGWIDVLFWIVLLVVVDLLN